jgi:carnitine O-acetyltransferase
VAFVRAFAEGDTDKDKDKLRALLSAATAKHRERATEASNGRAIDRHLFSLYTLNGEGGGSTPAIFNDAAWAKLNTSVLSTSNVNSPMMKGFSFGAVCPQGYGLAYTVTEHDIVVGVSNFVSDPDTGGSGFGGVQVSNNGSDVSTDSAQFKTELENALLEMRALFSA